MSRDVAQKIRRLLFLVPYVAKHSGGVPVEQLASLLEIDEAELLADLELLSQVGPPDGDPGEYLLVSVEHGRVAVELAHRLTRPLRLTPAEGCSLLLGIRALRDSGIAPIDDALGSAERKLLAALGRDASEAEALATGTVVAEPDRGVAGHLRQLVSAARGQRSVSVDYVAASTAQAHARDIDPYGIVHHAGVWYVVGHCHARGDVRTFRIDRIAALRTTDATFARPADFDLEAYRRDRLYVPSADAVRVRIQLDALAVTRIGAHWPVGDVALAPDGSATLTLDCEGFEWVTGWVLGLGRHAEIASPPAARAAMRARLERARAALPPP